MFPICRKKMKFLFSLACLSLVIHGGMFWVETHQEKFESPKEVNYDFYDVDFYYELEEGLKKH